MKLTTNKKDLLKGLKTAAAIIPNRSTLPILGNVRLEVTSGKTLRISATDLEVFITATVGVRATGAGATTAPAKHLLKFVKDLSGNPEIEIEVIETKIEIRAAGFKASFPTTPVEDYPVLPAFEHGKAVAIGKEVLAELFARTSKSISTDETRYVLNGVYLEFEKGAVTAVATDGRRLAHVKRGSGLEKKFSAKLIVPHCGVWAARDMLKEKTTATKVFVVIKDNEIAFSDGATTVHSRLIEGDFPKYQQIIDGLHGKQVARVNRVAFINGIKQAANGLLRRGSSVLFQIQENKLILKSTERDHETEAQVPAVYENQAPVEVRFNPAYVLDALESLDDSENVILRLDGDKNPGSVVPLEGALCQYVMMPMTA